MHSLSDIEVDFIGSDLESKGIVSEDLRDNLLDHICCIIEEEMDDKERKRLKKKARRLEGEADDLRIDIRAFERIHDLPRHDLY